MYDLPLCVHCFQKLLLLLTFPTLSGGIEYTRTESRARVLRSERSPLAATRSTADTAALDEKGRADLLTDSQASEEAPSAPQQQSNFFVTSQNGYFLHNNNGMKFNKRISVGTKSGNYRCPGIHHCQFVTFQEATDFCNNDMNCTGVLQTSNEFADGCTGGLGCFEPAAGQLEYDKDWYTSNGKTFERQFLAYGRFQDGRKFSDIFPVDSRKCQGTSHCQFISLHEALAFCDLSQECLGVNKMPNTTLDSSDNCEGGKGCFVPSKGAIQHDPVWLDEGGEIYLKQQEIAYQLRAVDGQLYDGRYPRGTAGCPGEFNCQYHNLADAKAYCNSNPTCKGVIKHFENQPGCTGGMGCFEPCRGKLTYDRSFLVNEGRLYERHLVR